MTPIHTNTIDLMDDYRGFINTQIIFRGDDGNSLWVATWETLSITFGVISATTKDYADLEKESHKKIDGFFEKRKAVMG